MREEYHIFYGLILLIQALFYSLLTLFFLKRENPEPNLTVKIIELRKFIDCFGLSIEADSSRVVKKNVCFFYIGYRPRISSGQLHISRHHLDR